MRLKLPLPNSFYKTIAKNISVQEIENFYRIASQESQKETSYLLATSGFELFANLNNNAPVWGVKQVGQFLYVCCGNNIYTVDGSGNVFLKGSIGTVTSHVQFEENGINVVVLKEAGDLWEVTSSGVTQITDIDYSSSSSISQSFGYFILPIAQSNEWQISDQDSIDFSGFIAKAESTPDVIVRTIQSNGETWFFKERNTEIWGFSGDVDFPYARTNVINKGAIARLGFAVEDTSLYFLANDKKIYQTFGYDYKPISTEAIEQIIAEMDVVNDAVFWTYIDGGQTFLTCLFPSEGVTYEANLSIRDEFGRPEWHRRTSKNLSRWRANCYENAFGENIIGDYENGKLYKIKFNTPTEDGQNITRSFVTPYFFELDYPISFDRIELDVEAGLGNVSGAGSDPMIYLSWSDDYGHTFSNQYPASLGKQGQYKYRPIWLGKGTARKRCLKFVVSDPIKIRISAIFADIQKLEA